MQARYYDPVIGRFYSNDPVDAVSHLNNEEGIRGFNRYSYAVNNPYKYTDPDGREIKVAKDLQKDYQQAKTYLTSKSSLAKAYFSRAERMDRTIRVERTSGGSEYLTRQAYL